MRTKPLILLLVGAAATFACATAPYGEKKEDAPLEPPPGSSASTKRDASDRLPPETTSTPIATTTDEPDEPLTPEEGDAGTPTTTPDAGVDAGVCRDAPRETVPTYQWKAPAPRTTPCTAADLAFFDGQISGTGYTYASLETGMRARNVACASCIFTRTADATWGPVVFVDANGGAFTNWGSCWVQAEGGSEECGREWQRFQSCVSDVCSECKGDPRTACRSEVAADRTSCGSLTFPSCPADRTQLSAGCKTLGKVVATVCGPAPTAAAD